MHHTPGRNPLHLSGNGGGDHAIGAAPGTELSADSSWVAFTAIHNTSVEGTSANFSTGALKLPTSGLSSCSSPGNSASPLARTTIVTASPTLASEAPRTPPTPPEPRIA